MENSLNDFISLNEVKHFLRITSDVDDDLINNLLQTAVFHIEKYLGYSVTTNQYEEKITKKITLLKQTPVFKVLSVTDLNNNSIEFKLLNDELEILNEVVNKLNVKYITKVNELPSHLKTTAMEIVRNLYEGNNDWLSSLSKLSNIKQYKI